MKLKDQEKLFIESINNHRLLIQKVCSVYASDTESRKDLFQEIVLQLWRSYPGFKNGSKFSTWLYRVAINTAITGIRKQRPHLTLYGDKQLPEVNEEDPPENRFADDLQRAVAHLSEIEKAIIMLYLEDHTYAEMQLILGINETALKVRMSRIKEKLRQITKTT